MVILNVPNQKNLKRVQSLFLIYLLLSGGNIFSQILHDNSCASNSTNYSLDWDSSPDSDQFNWTPQGGTSFLAANIEGSGSTIAFSLSGATSTLTTENSISTPGITNSLSGGADALHISSSGLDGTEEIELTMTFSPALAGNISFDLYNIIELSGGGAGGQQIEIFGLTTTGFALVPELTDNGSPSWELEGPGVLDGNATSVTGTNDQVGVNFKSISDISTIHIILRRCSGCGDAVNTEFAIGDIDICLSPDTDQDGIADTEDADDDNDGIPDEIEKCPSSAPVTADWDDYTYTDGDPNNTYALPDGTNMTVAISSNGASITAGETNSNLTGGQGGGTVGLFLNGNQNLQVNSIDVSFSWDRAISDLTYTIFDVDQLGGQYIDSLTIIGYYNGFVVFPNLTGSANNSVTQNRAVGDVSTDDALATANLDVSFTESIDSMIVYYGNGAGSPPAPGNQWITIWDFTYVGDCGSVDTDGDGVDDYLDIDADNDGIVDYIEWQASSATPVAPSGIDSDEDGIDDNFEALANSSPLDTDGDGVPDFKDTDSDNDGDLDILEAWDTNNDGSANTSPAGTDSDGDGLDDNFDDQDGFNSTTNVTNDDQDSEDFPNLDNAGTSQRDWRESNDPTDNDGDGISDIDDIDDDNDGILDVDEGCTTTASSPSGAVVANGGGNGVTGSLAFINDGDFSSDNGIILNRVGEYIVIDLGGTIPSGVDVEFTLWRNNTNGKTIRFAELPNSTANVGGGTNLTTTTDGSISGGGSVTTYVYTLGSNTQYVQIDMTVRSAGRIEIVEATIPAYIDCTTDTDNDGVFDGYDLDSDNDGIADIIEAGGVDINHDGIVDGVFRDTDGDGWSNEFDSDDGGAALTDADTDTDGLEDRIDIDADDDGIVDIIESQPSGTLIEPSGSDDDGDGVDDAFDVSSGNQLTVPVNTDGLDNPDYSDTDSDNDGDTDALEGWDTDNDGTADTTPAGTDTDNDGLDDNYDDIVGPNATTNPTNNQTSISFPNLDIVPTPLEDWREDGDYDGDGISDVDDIDDDNDGILDVNECDVSVIFEGGFDGIGGLTVGSNNLGVSIAPWILTSGGTNVIRVDGAGGTTYGIGGPEFDARGGAGNYFDINGTGQIYQTFSVSGTQQLFYEGYFSARDGGTGTGDISIRAGTGVAGAIQSTTSTITTSDNVNWTYASNSVTLTAGTYSYVVNMSNPINFDEGSITIICDTDDDGIPNQYDLDSDNDGIADIIEAGGVDNDGNGIVDGTFTDTDNDGWSDTFDPDNSGTVLTDPDTDSDGLNNRIDIDADDDGIIDIIEGQLTGTLIVLSGTDSDYDGIDDNFDPDNGNALITPVNTDATDNPDYTDTDADNDGDLDALEGWDTNNNGTANTLPSGSDSDDDGLDDNYDDIVGPNNTTNPTNNTQESTDFPNLDNTNSSQRDWREAPDNDEDGVADVDDIDDDNDGILDVDEGEGSNNPAGDEDGDGILNYLDLVDNGNGGDGSTTSYTDTDGNGIPDVFDTDADGIANHLDLDADDDGIADIIEAGGVDTDGDGRGDASSDNDGDGFLIVFDSDEGGTALANPDTDGDGFNNFLDLDSDSDGITDNVEGRLTINATLPSGNDIDNDGWDDAYDGDVTGGSDGAPIELSNNEGSGNPDYTDDDSDGDGKPDYVEGFDDDEDGFALNDLLTRASNYETAAANPLHYVNTDDADADGVPDWGEDDDTDGILNYLDPDNGFYVDTDGDGLINLFDTDNNGVASITPDTDGNGEYDFRDLNNEIAGLPIELLEFEANKLVNQVQLIWTTGSEINNDYFTIERSANGQNFEEILRIKGAGNSNHRNSYKLIDESPLAGYNYYLLRQTDYNGRTEAFGPNAVFFEKVDESNIKIYPIPGTIENLTIELSNFEIGIYTIQVLNAEAKVIEQQTIRLANKESKKINLTNAKDFAKGAYFLRVISNLDQKVKKFYIH